MDYKSLFMPVNIGRFHAKNRFIRAATKEELCDKEGHLNNEIYEIYNEFALGGVGTIIVSSARVRLFEGTKHGGLLRLDCSELLEEYSHLAKICKQEGATALIQATYSHRDIDAMTLEELEQIVEDFKKAVLFAHEAGFDGIEIHAAHTVFMSYFLSPKYNHRTDEYGTNKNLLALRVVEALRKIVREDFIIIVKVNCQDFEDGGLTEEDSLKYCMELVQAGVDGIEVSGNNPIRKVRGKEEESYFASFAAKLKKNVSVPIILVGGNKSLDKMQNLYNESGIDLFSMSRALTCEPNLVQRWAEGDFADAKCTSCNACMNTHAHACILRKKR